MYVFAVFEHSVALELAITDIERSGIVQDDILAVPLSKTGTVMSVIDTIHRSDGGSVLDGAAAGATILMIFGAIYGFVLPWGPIVWGLIGFGTGFSIGFLLDFFFTKKDKKYMPMGRTPEVILVVNCEKGETKKVEEMLRRHEPLGVAIVGSAEK